MMTIRDGQNPTALSNLPNSLGMKLLSRIKKPKLLLLAEMMFGISPPI